MTVGRVAWTPSWRSATSGLMITRPVPVTLIVCSGAVVVPSTARIPWGAKAGQATAAAIRPVAMPRASQRARELGRGIVTVVVDIGRSVVIRPPTEEAVLERRRRRRAGGSRGPGAMVRGRTGGVRQPVGRRGPDRG